MIQDVEHDHVDAAELEVLQPANHLGGIVEQIGNQHDDAALGQAHDARHAITSFINVPVLPYL